VNDVTFLIRLVAKLVWNIKAKIVNVENSFLYGGLKQEIFMEIPEGIGCCQGRLLVFEKENLLSDPECKTVLK
jgi:hypothetical protein